MANYVRTNTSGLAWTNTTTAWTPSGAAPTTAADAAQFTSAITTANSTTAATATVGQIEVIAPSAAVTIAASAGQTLTLSPAASFSNIGIKITGSTGGALSIGAALSLASSQEWQVASGRTLNLSSGVSITGNARNLTISGGGTTNFNSTQANWINSTLTVAGGLVVAVQDGRNFGASSNTVVVNSGGAVRVADNNPAGVASYTVSGSGNALQAGAIFFSGVGAFGAGKTITLSGASPVIGIQAGTQAGTIADNGTVTGNVTFNMSGTNIATATFTNASSFAVPTGNYVVLRGVNPLTGAVAAADFSVSGSDLNGLGNAANAVNVKSALRIVNGTDVPTTFARNYLFDGDPTNATPTTYPLSPKAIAGSGFTFQGTISIGTPGYWIKANPSGGAGANFIQFGNTTGGKIDGQVNLRVFSSSTTLRLHPNLDISTWVPSGGVGGEIYAFNVSYGVAPTGAATWAGTGTIDNISGAALTLAHSSLSIVSGTITFTGTDDLSTGVAPITTTGGVTFATLAAGKRLRIPGNISGTGTLSKTDVGTLTLGGSNTGFSSCQHQGGVLELNNNNALGTSTATFIITAATANTLDSTDGATLANSGQISLNSNFTWGGSADLTLGSGNISLGASRTITFVAGKQGTLKAPGNIVTNIASSLTIGGSPGGATKSRFWLVGTNALASPTHSVTAGYFRISNSLGLGAVGTPATWTVSSGAALELADGITPTSNKTAAILGTGPDGDGALRSVNGSNTFAGPISISSAAVTTRFQVDAGTFTLSGAQIAPAAPGTPLAFTALGVSAVLNQQRQLGANVGNVSTNNGGTGTVVLSTSNLHTGSMTCEGGTTRVTHINATGSGAGNDVFVPAPATLESTVQSVFSAKLSLGTNGSGARAILKFAA